MRVLVVHNDDEVKDVFNTENIIDKLSLSNYWEEIVERLEDSEDLEENEITLEDILLLHSDGDSYLGFTLCELK